MCSLMCMSYNQNHLGVNQCSCKCHIVFTLCTKKNQNKTAIKFGIQHNKNSLLKQARTIYIYYQKNKKKTNYECF